MIDEKLLLAELQATPRLTIDRVFEIINRQPKADEWHTGFPKTEGEYMTTYETKKGQRFVRQLHYYGYGKWQAVYGKVVGWQNIPKGMEK